MFYFRILLTNLILNIYAESLEIYKITFLLGCTTTIDVNHYFSRNYFKNGCLFKLLSHISQRLTHSKKLIISENKIIKNIFVEKNVQTASLKTNNAITIINNTRWAAVISSFWYYEGKKYYVKWSTPVITNNEVRLG